MVLAVFASSASAADTVEIRGPVYNGTDLADIGSVSMNANTFAAFFYDIDEGTFTESLSILGDAENTIPEGQLVYTTQIQNVDFEYEDGFKSVTSYPVLGFFAEAFIPLETTSPDKLAKLVLDDDEKYTLRTGEILDIGEGYSLEAKQVDVDGNKVWLEFSKDGEFIDDEIIDVSAGGNDWVVDLDDIEDEDDVIVMRVHVNQVFQGAVDSIAQIEGLWLIDYENAFTIESDDEFGELEVTAIGTDSLTLKNKDDISLTKDDTEPIAEGLSILVADDNDAFRFYVFKEFTEPGTYEIRGTVVDNNGTTAWDWNSTTFAGFFYDIDDDVGTETLEVTGSAGETVEITEANLVYTTTIQNVDFAYEDGFKSVTSYPVLGFFAEAFIPLETTSPDKLAKLILDDDTKYTLRTGEILDIGEGYSLEAKQVDVDGNKVWLEFSKDGEFIDDEIIDVSAGGNDWVVDLDDIEDEDDVIVMRVHVNQVFQGAVDSIAQIEGLWLIDYENAMTIESDDEFDELEVTAIGTNSLTLKNKDDISLNKDDDEVIAGGMSFKMANNDGAFVRFYPYVEVTIEGGEEVADDEEEPEEPVTPVDDTNVTEPVDTEPVDTNVTEPVEDTEPVNDTTGEEEPVEDTPGFEAIFAITGLLAVVYLIRRND